MAIDRVYRRQSLGWTTCITWLTVLYYNWQLLYKQRMSPHPVHAVIHFDCHLVKPSWPYLSLTGWHCIIAAFLSPLTKYATTRSLHRSPTSSSARHPVSPSATTFYYSYFVPKQNLQTLVLPYNLTTVKWCSRRHLVDAAVSLDVSN